eukprot:CAMPEP_0118694444 /NCGR_PEP_ID=MMETSP0800-20121206/12526_1 /TAXON_ID=210618 ORGANISM="Striatella unipunctata, Strain CCMP2910" /NCGR_SAMPLE_ID=MMETSP0800 /ASSEMBLY_ACC=CAM_ASM_000638 /LENGTH=90 /DNA_ID=CAMNT_0006592909 /DNA_START=42 /DNA_END=314 /DNA_ORIENTATION=+
MPFTAAIFGGAMGASAHYITNAVRKVPLSRAPWNYILYFGIGCWAGNGLYKWEERLVEDINEMRTDRGMAPMTSTGGYYLRYNVADAGKE